MNTDSEIPAAKAENDSTPSGLNHCGSMDSPAGAVPSAVCRNAAIANHSSTTTWKATRTYWTTLVASMPR
jgi:hypothetical protein